MIVWMLRASQPTLARSPSRPSPRAAFLGGDVEPLRRRNPCCGGPLPVDPDKGHVPVQVPDATKLHHDVLARRNVGASQMGAIHGAWCLGCCWLLCAIMFPLGMMNVAALATGDGHRIRREDPALGARRGPGRGGRHLRLRPLDHYPASGASNLSWMTGASLARAGMEPRRKVQQMAHRSHKQSGHAKTGLPPDSRPMFSGPMRGNFHGRRFQNELFLPCLPRIRATKVSCVSCCPKSAIEEQDSCIPENVARRACIDWTCRDRERTRS